MKEAVIFIISLVLFCAIIVYFINNEFWRDPYFSSWNNMGHKNRNKHNRHNHRYNYGFGLDHDSLTAISISGVTLIDTTFYIDHYFLDVDSDVLRIIH